MHYDTNEITAVRKTLIENGFFADPSIVSRNEAIERLHMSTAIYTAEPVVEQLLDMIEWPHATRHLVDPSCGDGSFLGSALVRLLAARPKATDAEIIQLISGWEIHSAAAEESRERLAAILVKHGRHADAAATVAGLIVRNGDFLLEGPRERTYDVIAANPPYLRYTNLSQPLRGDYERELPVYAQADMLHSFIDRCVSTLRPDGEIVMVTSDRWLTNQNAAKLRELVGQTMGVAHLERLDCASVFYRPKVRKAGTPPRIHPIAVCLRRNGLGTMPMTKEPIYPDATDLPLPADGRTLGSIAKVILAPWVGTPGIFMVDAETAAARGLPAEYLLPAIDTDDIEAGVLLDESVSPRRFVIRADKAQEPCAAVLSLLDERLPAMSPRGRQFPRWVTPERLDKHDLSQPCLLIPRIARSLKPVHVPAGVLPTDHNLTIVTSGSATLVEIEAALSHPLAQKWIEQRAARLEGGYLSMTTRLLRNLPVWA